MKTQLYTRFTLLPGAHHHQSFHNRQDMYHAAFVRTEHGDVEVAVVGCDGCSQSSNAEIGAGLAAYYAAETLVDLVSAYGMEDGTAVDLLHSAMREYLRGIIALQPHGAFYLERLDAERHGGPPMDVDSDYRLQQVLNWIGNHLLFTVVGAYFGTGGLLTFQRGDGGYAADDNVYVEDHRDMPPYMAYMFFPRQKIAEGEARLRERNLPGLPPPGFNSCYTPEVKRAAIFTDGMPTGYIPAVWELLDPVDQLEYRPDRLSREARKWLREGLLRDDLFLAAFLREPL
ncbi:MAG: hypothetical protein OHK0046_23860 [Anaerolineae bacterium]